MKATKRKKETMTKKKKQITTCDYDDVDRENKPLVYMFHNVKHNGQSTKVGSQYL